MNTCQALKPRRDKNTDQNVVKSATAGGLLRSGIACLAEDQLRRILASVPVTVDSSEGDLN